MQFNITYKISLLLACVLLFGASLIGQEQKVAVFLKDKPQNEFNPYEYFDQKAIERRIKHGLPLYNETDLPLNSNYVSKIGENVISVKGASRWLNVVFVYATSEQIEFLKGLEFVKKLQLMTPAEKSLSSKNVILEPAKSLIKKQVNRLGYEYFKNEGIDGAGVRVAVFDAGFPYVNEHEAFDHLRSNNRILKTYDFVAKKEDVYGKSSHGAMCLSNITGISPEGPLGLATGAEFLLARTERGLLEPFSEEENWLMAAEWADKNGADIISSSLGYTKKRYETSEMDGKTSFVAEAARFATRKGMLVVNAAGNEGTGEWKTLGTPADVDSVLTVGGVHPKTDYHAGFSSYGPNANKQLKPNVVAYGLAAVAGKNQSYKMVSGTSFATPLVAGFAACVMQQYPELTNMEVFKLIEKSAHLYPYFDYAHGFGIPQADAILNLKEPVQPTFKLFKEEGTYTVEVNEMPEEKPTFKSDEYMYYHFENNSGYLSKYYVIKVEEKQPLNLFKDEFEPYDVLRIHYRGYTITKDLKAIQQ